MDMNELVEAIKLYINRGHSGVGNIYCIRNTQTNQYKIGCAKNVAWRVKSLEVASAESFVVVVATIPNINNYRTVETLIHSWLNKYRNISREGRKTEWFNTTEEKIIDTFNVITHILGMESVEVMNVYANDLIKRKARCQKYSKKVFKTINGKRKYIFYTWKEAADFFGCTEQTIINSRTYGHPLLGKYIICA